MKNEIKQEKMDLVLTVERILEPQRFTKRDGTASERYAFVGIYRNGKYETRLAVDVMKPEVWAGANIRVGGTYSVSFKLESREWKGRWFTSCSAWKILPVGAVAASVSATGAGAPLGAVKGFDTAANDNGLPF